MSRRSQYEKLQKSVEQLRDDMQGFLDELIEGVENLPENLQESQRAEDMRNRISVIEEQIGDLDEIVDTGWDDMI